MLYFNKNIFGNTDQNKFVLFIKLSRRSHDFFTLFYNKIAIELELEQNAIEFPFFSCLQTFAAEGCYRGPPLFPTVSRVRAVHRFVEIIIQNKSVFH